MNTPLSIVLRNVAVLAACWLVLGFARWEALGAELGARSATAIVISVPDQLLAVIQGDRISATYPVSTSKFGLGDEFGSYKTPLGILQVCDKIGGHLPLGAVIKKRSSTGEVVAPNSPGRDAVVSRILWLEGKEAGNSHAYDRGIYIHGTPEESRIGQPVSWGCVRMRSRDIAQLFDVASKGTPVEIVNRPIASGSFKCLASALPAPSAAPPTLPIYRLLLVATTADIPSSFLDIRWSAGISDWSAAGLRFKTARAARVSAGVAAPSQESP